MEETNLSQDQKMIDGLVNLAVFGSESEKQEARFKIWQLGRERGVVPASINDFYMARGSGELPLDFTVPAMNLRGMTYDLGRSIFSVAVKHNVGAMVFEIARSEMAYTGQSPREYVSVLTAAAVREGWSGPLFVQGDHFQAKAESMGVPKAGELESIKQLVDEAMKAGFYNIDIDMSTLVDLDKESVADQQVPNVKHTLELIQYVREHQPDGIEVSLGGEIGHIGGKNSTVEDFVTFMSGLKAGLPEEITGISKISVATGTSHGGVVKPDGSIASVDVDFSVLSDISKIGRENYQIGGAVQHGASTLPDEFFGQFAKSEAIEVHFATGLQNIQMDHPEFPNELRDEIYAWIDDNKQAEREQGQTDEQFHYKLRKKAWGKFKKQTWEIEESRRVAIRAAISERIEFLFKELNVIGSADLIQKYVKPVVLPKTLEDFADSQEKAKEVVGLSD